MRRKAHVRFGGRSEETGWLRGRYRASLRSNFVKVRQDHRVVSMAVVIAVGVNQDGQREVLGLDVGPSEDGAFWHAFLRSLVARGLIGVKVVTGWWPACYFYRTPRPGWPRGLTATRSKGTCCNTAPAPFYLYHDGAQVRGKGRPDG